jgi:hypothetical protein
LCHCHGEAIENPVHSFILYGESGERTAKGIQVRISYATLQGNGPAQFIMMIFIPEEIISLLVRRRRALK